MAVSTSERTTQASRGRIEALLQEPWLTIGHIEALYSLLGQPEELTQDARDEFAQGILIKFATDDYNKNNLFTSRELSVEQRAIKLLWVAKAEHHERTA